MKQKIVVAATAAVIVLGAGAYTAVAAGTDDRPGPSVTTPATTRATTPATTLPTTPPTTPPAPTATPDRHGGRTTPDDNPGAYDRRGGEGTDDNPGAHHQRGRGDGGRHGGRDA
ncbi:hypothetical protein OG552_34115 [Streptomyces sp. NBC_01476]|uniref:hypothetical protein n=1 Tax=Streptomyces sp. NBC_01476 TaxID=2903881 RepID=UPI002E2FAB4B|nr:hypothetical protein [Streptomyces sp. NBC_01476]